MGTGLSVPAPEKATNGFVGVYPSSAPSSVLVPASHRGKPPVRNAVQQPRRESGSSAPPPAPAPARRVSSGEAAAPAKRRSFLVSPTRVEGTDAPLSPLVPLELEKNTAPTEPPAEKPKRGKKSAQLTKALRQAVLLAQDRIKDKEKFKRDERHLVMQLYEMLGLYSDAMLTEPRPGLQECLVAYSFPPPSMSKFLNRALDIETYREILGEKEANSRMAENEGVLELEADPPVGSDCLLRKQLRRWGVSSETNTQASAFASSNQQGKTPEQVARLTAICKNNILFKPLDSRDRLTLFSALQEETFPRNTEIIVQGDEGDSYYVIETGTCEVVMEQKNGEDEEEEGEILAELGTGDSFGELALMYGTQRAATVRSTTEVLCWVLDRDTYRGMLLNITFKKRERYMAFLDKISILSALTPYNKARIADMLEPCEAEPGESICQEGTDGDTFFMIEDGRFSIRTKAEGEVGQLGQGEYFGELALLYSQPRKATVVSLTKSHLVRLRRKEFDSYLGSLEQLRSEADRYRGEATLLHPVGGAETNSDIGCLLDNFEVCSSSSGRMHTPMRGP